MTATWSSSATVKRHDSARQVGYVSIAAVPPWTASRSQADGALEAALGFVPYG
jgi:hypothetical protein